MLERHVTFHHRRGGDRRGGLCRPGHFKQRPRCRCRWQVIGQQRGDMQQPWTNYKSEQLWAPVFTPTTQMFPSHPSQYLAFPKEGSTHQGFGFETQLQPLDVCNKRRRGTSVVRPTLGDASSPSFPAFCGSTTPACHHLLLT